MMMLTVLFLLSGAIFSNLFPVLQGSVTTCNGDCAMMRYLCEAAWQEQDNQEKAWLSFSHCMQEMLQNDCRKDALIALNEDFKIARGLLSNRDLFRLTRSRDLNLVYFFLVNYAFSERDVLEDLIQLAGEDSTISDELLVPYLPFGNKNSVSSEDFSRYLVKLACLGRPVLLRELIRCFRISRLIFHIPGSVFIEIAIAFGSDFTEANRACCGVLLENGAIINVSNDAGETAAMWALGNCNFQLLDWLLSVKPPLEYDTDEGIEEMAESGMLVRMVNPETEIPLYNEFLAFAKESARGSISGKKSLQRAVESLRSRGFNLKI